MFKRLKNNFKVSNKKIYDICLIVICIGVLLLIAGSEIFGKERNEANQDIIVKELGKELEPYSRKNIDEKLSNVLSNIKGAGKVDVMITYDRSVERIFAYETKNNSSQRSIDDIHRQDKEEKIAYKQDSNGARIPILLKEMHPRAKGAIVIADGADDVLVRDSLSRAVQVLLNLPRHSVSVLKREK